MSAQKARFSKPVIMIVGFILLALITALILRSRKSPSIAANDPENTQPLQPTAAVAEPSPNPGAGADAAVFLGDPPLPAEINGFDYIQAYLYEPHQAVALAVEDLGSGVMQVAYDLGSPVPKGVYSGVLLAESVDPGAYDCTVDDANGSWIICQGPAAPAGVEFAFEIYKDVQLPPGPEQPLDRYFARFPSLLLEKDFSSLAAAAHELGIPLDRIDVPQAWDILAYCLNFLETGETIPGGCYPLIFSYYNLDADWFAQMVPDVEVDLCLFLFQQGMEIDEACARHIIEIGAEGEDFWKGIVPEVQVGIPGAGRPSIYSSEMEGALFDAGLACLDAIGGGANPYDLDSWDELHSFYYFLNGLFRPDDSCSGMFECIGETMQDISNWFGEKLGNLSVGLYWLFTDPEKFWTDYLHGKGALGGSDLEDLQNQPIPAACQDFFALADSTYFTSNKYGVADACARTIGYDHWSQDSDYDWPDDLYYHLKQQAGDDYSELSDPCRMLMQNCDLLPGFGCFRSDHYDEGGFPPGYDPFGFSSVTSTDQLCEEARAAGEDSFWCQEPSDSSNPFLASSAACADTLGWPQPLDSYFAYLDFTTFLSLQSPWLAGDWPDESCRASLAMLGDDNPANLPMSSFGENQSKPVLFALGSGAIFTPQPTAKPQPTSDPLARIRGTVSYGSLGQGGFTVTIAHGNCSGIAIIAAQTTTAANGAYSVGGLVPGPYCVSINKFGAWDYLNPASGKTAVSTSAGSATTANFSVTIN